MGRRKSAQLDAFESFGLTADDLDAYHRTRFESFDEEQAERVRRALDEERRRGNEEGARHVERVRVFWRSLRVLSIAAIGFCIGTFAHIPPAAQVTIFVVACCLIAVAGTWAD